MKREDVKNKIPGITDEQLDWLMGENGRDVTAERKKADGLQAQVDSLTAQVATAQDGLKAFGEHKPEDFAAAQQQITQPPTSWCLEAKQVLSHKGVPSNAAQTKKATLPHHCGKVTFLKRKPAPTYFRRSSPTNYLRHDRA